jgi:regulator of sigma E protease
MQSPGLILYIVGFALLLGPLVFFHELGHYLAARLFGIKSEVFSIGFGPEITGWTDKRGTRWKLSWIPLGGYVRFAGDMNPASQPDPAWLALPPAERARTFQAKPLWQRAIVVLAGPVTNFLLALLILTGFALA